MKHNKHGFPLQRLSYIAIKKHLFYLLYIASLLIYIILLFISAI